MARIPQEIIDRINATADIVDVVSKTVELKKRGRNFLAYVPFTMKRPHPSASHQTKVFIIVLDAGRGAMPLILS